MTKVTTDPERDRDREWTVEQCLKINSIVLCIKDIRLRVEMAFLLDEPHSHCEIGQDNCMFRWRRLTKGNSLFNIK